MKKFMVAVLAMFAFASFAFADVDDNKTAADVTKTVNTDVIGNPDPVDVKKAVPVYTLGTWEGELNGVINDANALAGKAADVAQNSQMLSVKPDGSPLRNAASVLENAANILHDAADQASESDPVANKRIDELEERFLVVWKYQFGPKFKSFGIPLDGEKRGYVEVELGNGLKQKVAYNAGSDLVRTPDVVDIPVAAVMALPDGRYAVATGVFLRGHNYVQMEWEPYPMDKKGASWFVTKVYNVCPDQLNFLMCGEAKCVPFSPNAHTNK